jgi:hypothetical protein
MAETASVQGGARHALSRLSPHEHAIARAALAKLGSTTDNVRHVSVGSDSVAVGSGNATLLGLGSATTIGGLGSDSLHGGSGIKSIGNDTLIAGSAHSAIQQSLGNANTTGTSGFHSSSATIKVAGQTAASFQGGAHSETKAGASTTINLTDKTTVRLIGIKGPHGGGKAH